MNLTPGQERALMQIGYGVTGRKGGFYDENGERLDGRSWPRLVQLGLASIHTRGAAPMVGCLNLRDKGWELFYEIEERLYQESQHKRKRLQGGR
jgi:hypothetical protein